MIWEHGSAEIPGVNAAVPVMYWLTPALWTLKIRFLFVYLHKKKKKFSLFVTSYIVFKMVQHTLSTGSGSSRFCCVCPWLWAVSREEQRCPARLGRCSSCCPSTPQLCSGTLRCRKRLLKWRNSSQKAMEGEKGLVCGGLGQKSAPERPGEERGDSDMRLWA